MAISPEEAKAARARLNASRPKIVSSNPRQQRRDVAASLLPEGATLSVPAGPSRRMGTFDPALMSNFVGGGGGGQTFQHMQRPYLPEIESPDRIQYPTDRRMANYYWRLFHKFDPVFGTAMDMYSEMLVSDYDVIVDETKDKEINDTVDLMCEKTHFQERCRQMVVQYNVIGEVIPHTFFDEDLGIWTYIAMHNPDYIEVQDSPIIDMDPIISFIPDDALIELLSDRSPESMELRQSLPSEFVAKVLARQPIRLQNSNCSFIARKLNPYDERGTSLASRLWRIWMVEDAVYASTIATYRRHAAPIKVAKLGDASTNWIPEPEVEAELLSMLSRMETDPQAWLVWNYGIQFEAFGTTDRAVSIKGEHDVIEKVKLLGMGLSKSFMTGEVTYASAKSGLQVFLRRLLSLRQYLEAVWIYPKFFRPISLANDWIKSKPNEVDHGYRVKRTAQELEEQKLIIIPKLKWHNKLDPEVESDVLQAYLQMEKFGFQVSKASVGAVVDLDWENELRNSAEEFKKSKEIVQEVLGPQMANQFWMEKAPKKPGGAAGGGAPPGGPGGGQKPPGAAGAPPGGPKPDASAPPGSGEAGEPEGGIESPDQGGMGADL